MRRALTSGARFAGGTAWACVALLAACSGIVHAQVVRDPASGMGQNVRVVEVPDDPRSVILLRYDCRSDIGRREVSLFGNGVIRLRESKPDVAEGEGELEMRLHTLDPDSFEGYRNRIEDEDLSRADVERGGVSGEWVERCVFEVLEASVGGEGRGLLRRFDFSPYTRLPLTLSRVVRVAEELAAEVQAPIGSGLPPGYEAIPGDVLERVDGELFRVVAYTVDRKGVELQGVHVPLVIYVAPDDLPKRFVRLESRVRSDIR